jgi:hypothetical protein
MHAASGRLSALRPPLIGADRKRRKKKGGVKMMKTSETTS